MVQAAQVSALGTQVAQLRAEVDAQRLALAAIAAERDAARSSAADSSQRLKARPPSPCQGTSDQPVGLESPVLAHARGILHTAVVLYKSFMHPLL